MFRAAKLSSKWHVCVCRPLPSDRKYIKNRGSEEGWMSYGVITSVGGDICSLFKAKGHDQGCFIDNLVGVRWSGW